MSFAAPSLPAFVRLRPSRSPGWLVIALLLATLLPSSVAVAQTRVTGIDVSQFQGNMNWTTAYNKGVRFAFIRASRGPTTGANSVADTKLSANVPGARAVGILAGVYHYGRPDLIAVATGQPTATAISNSAKDEASHFVSIAGPYMGSGYLRPVLDLEETGAATGITALNAASLSTWANTFMNEVQRLTGAEPLVYMNTNFTQVNVNSTMANRDLWVANWNSTTYGNPLTTGSPPTGAWQNNGQTWSFWQYSSTPNALGSAYGAQSTDIDLNVANGDINFVRSFVVPEPAGLAGLVFGGMGLLARRRGGRAHSLQSEG